MLWCLAWAGAPQAEGLGRRRVNSSPWWWPFDSKGDKCDKHVQWSRHIFTKSQFISIYTQKISVYINNTRSCFVSVVLVCLGHQGYLNRRLTTFFWLATPRTRTLAFCIAASQPFEALQQTPLFCRLCLRRRWAQGCCHVCKGWCPGQESLLNICSEMDQLLPPGICHLSPFPNRSI
jgi:hypothetical protein